MKEFNFKSQICTDKNQSERLLALSLKKETADMTIHIKDDGGWYVTAEPFCEWEDDRNTFPSLVEPEPIVPAWSLHRLMQLDLSSCKRGAAVAFHTESVNNAYECLINHIEWLIKEGYFNKEYLENGNC